MSSEAASSSSAIASPALSIDNHFALSWQKAGSLLYLTHSSANHAAASIASTSIAIPSAASSSSSTNATAAAPATKLACFDMDGTLILPKSNRPFPKDRQDWKWYSSNVPKQLRKLHEQGYIIVIFTNQKGISTQKQSPQHIQGKILDMIRDARVPMRAYAATGDDLFRKPDIGMWQEYVKHHTSHSLPQIDIAASFYVGDAAGRPAGWDGTKRRKDHSDGDKLFAEAVGLTFHTPEEYFLGHAKYVHRSSVSSSSPASSSSAATSSSISANPTSAQPSASSS